MKCPLIMFDRYTTFEKISTEIADCLKEQCAWWMDGDGICAIPALAAYCNEVVLELDNIKVRMPKDLAPGR